MLILRPVASPNHSIIVMKVPTSSLIGLRKTTASSSYRDKRNCAVRSLRGDISPSYVSVCKTCCRVSIARMKRYGESGPPCLSPRQCSINLPGMPFSLTAEDEEVNNNDSQLHQWLGNPQCSRSSRRYSHETESKALEISSLNSSAGVFFR
jgi:hypothetical protein